MLQSQIFFFKVAAHIKSRGVLVAAYLSSNIIQMFVHKTDLAGVAKKVNLQTGHSTILCKETTNEKLYEKMTHADVYTLEKATASTEASRKINLEIE